jgi:hypothetical protein
MMSNVTPLKTKPTAKDLLAGIKVIDADTMSANGRPCGPSARPPRSRTGCRA